MATPPRSSRDRHASRGTILNRSVGCLLALLLGGTSLTATFAQTPGVTAVREARERGDLDAALKAIDKLENSSDLALDLVLLARSGKGTLAEADLHGIYQRAAECLMDFRSPPSKTRQILLQAVATHFEQAQQSGTTARLLLTALGERSSFAELDDRRKQSAAQLALSAAFAEMTAERPESSATLYNAVLRASDQADNGTWLSDADRAMATLGLGWSLALQPGRESDAVHQLSSFLERFPDHGDAFQASAMRLRCLQNGDDDDATAKAATSFFRTYGNSPIAGQVALGLFQDHELATRSDVQTAIGKWIADTELAPIPRDTLKHFAVTSALSSSQEEFDRLTQKLGSEDESGQRIADLLSDLGEAHPDVAERIAIALLASMEAQPMAVESTCRWCGRTGRWSLMALNAESLDPAETSPDRRTPHTDRLFAEALTRVGKTKLALPWWKRLVDTHQAEDFATLLRCAETAVAAGTLADAQERLAHVRNASQKDPEPRRKPLLDLLVADVHVRKLEFDLARSQLESVVRSPDAGATLRARAQWMIGETYVMQSRFADAIGAYRLVEGFDADGPFVAPALIQAGKAFEQLGRTREAGVCYGTLLERFADSAHAAEAQRRMAMLPSGGGGVSPGDSPLDGSKPAETPIRR